MNVQHYTYRVFWSENDQEYVGVCAEFPSLSWLDENQADAFSGIIQLVRDVVDDMEKNNERIPVPLYNKKYSGNISFRTTSNIHRDLVIAAAENGVSLNRHINALIAR